MRFHHRIIAILLCASPLALYAQEGSALQDYEHALLLNPTLSSSNPAFIGSADRVKLSVAEIAVEKTDGELKAIEASPDAFEGSAMTESYTRISDRIAFYGKLSYSYFKGNSMGAEVFMDPGFNPVNFLESSEDNLGVKIRELYHLIGGMSYDFSERWSAGLKIDYEAGNMAKRRDPRFKNIWMDLDLSAGAVFSPSASWSFGATLDYDRTVETVKGHVYGTTDKQYTVFTDKGGFWGISEMLSGDYPNLPDSEDRPMINNIAGLELEAVHKGPFFFSNSLYGKYRTGRYGKGSHSSPKIFEFSGFEAGYSGRLQSRCGDNIHSAYLKGSFSLLGNNENTYKYITPTGENTKVEYYGQNHILDLTSIDASLGYSFAQGVGGYLPKAEYGIDALFSSRSRETTLYPYYRTSSDSFVNAAASASFNFNSGASWYSIGAEVSFRTGFGVPKEDGSYATSTSSNLKSFDSYLNRQFEYVTASRAGAALSFRYTRLMSSSFALYIEARDSMMSMLAEPEFLGGRTRNLALVTIGCNF